jgi:hypothetical protein
MTVTWSEDVDPSTLAAAITLTSLGGDDVPIDVAAMGTNAARIRPQQGLRFWGAYQLSIDAGVTGVDGAACDAAAVAFSTVVPVAAPRTLRPAAANGVFLIGTTAVTSSKGYRGFQTFDLSGATPAQPAAEVLTTQQPGRVEALGGFAYASAGADGVLILDATSSPPAVVGHMGSLGTAIDVAVFSRATSTYVVIADGSALARFVDATTPTAPVDHGLVDLGSPPPVSVAAAAASDPIVAFGADTRVILTKASAATPPVLAAVGSFDTGRVVTDVAIVGSVVYAAIGAYGVVSIDISDPTTPKLISAAPGAGGVCGFNCTDNVGALFVDGSDLFATDVRHGGLRYALDGNGGMTLASTYPVTTSAHGIVASGAQVVVAADEGVLVFDRASNMAAPTAASQGGHGIAHTVSVAGPDAYVGADLLGIQTFSLATPDAPDLVDREDTVSSKASDVGTNVTIPTPAGLVVSEGRNGMSTFDLTDPAKPAFEATLATTDGTANGYVDGTTAFMCTGNTGLVAVDVSDMSSPKELGLAGFTQFGVDGCNQPVPVGNLVYVGTTTALRVLDATDPTAMQWVGSSPDLPTGASVSAVDARDGRLFALIAQSNLDAPHLVSHKLASFDLTNPTAPALVWMSAELGGGSAIAHTGNTLFVSASDVGVIVLDVTDPTSPFLEGTVAMPGLAAWTAFGDGVAYVAQGAGGVQAIETGPLPTDDGMVASHKK